MELSWSCPLWRCFIYHSSFVMFYIMTYYIIRHSSCFYDVIYLLSFVMFYIMTYYIIRHSSCFYDVIYLLSFVMFYII